MNLIFFYAVVEPTFAVVEPVETTIFIFSKNPLKSTQFIQNNKLHHLNSKHSLKSILIL